MVWCHMLCALCRRCLTPTALHFFSIQSEAKRMFSFDFQNENAKQMFFFVRSSHLSCLIYSNEKTKTKKKEEEEEERIEFS